MKVHRYLGMFVSPDITPGKLFSKLDIVCDEAKQALLRERRDPFRDDYRVPVFFMAAGRFKSYEEAASRVACSGEKRPLTLRELLTLNLHDPMIRKRSPIFAGDFVLEFGVYDREEGGVLVKDRRWMVRLSTFHRGTVIDSDSLFAMTERTAVDRGKFHGGLFKESSTDMADDILRNGSYTGQTLRLTA